MWCNIGMQQIWILLKKKKIRNDCYISGTKKCVNLFLLENSQASIQDSPLMHGACARREPLSLIIVYDLEKNVLIAQFNTCIEPFFFCQKTLQLVSKTCEIGSCWHEYLGLLDCVSGAGQQGTNHFADQGFYDLSKID